MRLENYFPAKNNVLLEEVKVASSGNIILAEDRSVGYYKIVAIGPLCERASIGDFVVSSLQMGMEISFEDKPRMQLPEPGIDGYYQPTNEELENPVPIFKDTPEEEEELNVIDSDSDGGNNDLGIEPELRDN